MKSSIFHFETQHHYRLEEEELQNFDWYLCYLYLHTLEANLQAQSPLKELV